jgi:hypothetical protein
MGIKYLRSLAQAKPKIKSTPTSSPMFFPLDKIREPAKSPALILGKGRSQLAEHVAKGRKFMQTQSYSLPSVLASAEEKCVRAKIQEAFEVEIS